MKRWGHVHSAAAGLVGGLIVMQNGWLILAAVVLAAVAGWWAHALRGRIGGAVRTAGSIVSARAATELERGKRVRAARRRDLEQARDRRADREKRETEAYWKGVRDGTP